MYVYVCVYVCINKYKSWKERTGGKQFYLGIEEVKLGEIFASYNECSNKAECNYY